MPEVKIYDDFESISDECELVDLIIYEVRGVRNGSGIDGDPDDDDLDDDDLDLDAQVFSRFLESDTTFEVRQRLRVTANSARFTVDAGAIFEFPQKSEFTAEARKNFISRIGLMVLHPHVRESLHSLSSKLGVDPVLLPIRRSFDLEPLDPSTADLSLPLSSHD